MIREPLNFLRSYRLKGLSHLFLGFANSWSLRSLLPLFRYTFTFFDKRSPGYTLHISDLALTRPVSSSILLKAISTSRSLFQQHFFFFASGYATPPGSKLPATAETFPL